MPPRDVSWVHETLLTHAQLHARHFLVAQAAYVRWEVHRGGEGGSEEHVTAALRSFLSVLRASLPPGQPSLSAAFKSMELAHVLVTASSSCLASAPRPASAFASASPSASPSSTNGVYEWAGRANHCIFEIRGSASGYPRVRLVYALRLWLLSERGGGGGGGHGRLR